MILVKIADKANSTSSISCVQCFRDAELLKIHGSRVVAVYAINIAAQELGLYLLCLTTVY